MWLIELILKSSRITKATLKLCMELGNMIYDISLEAYRHTHDSVCYHSLHNASIFLCSLVETACCPATLFFYGFILIAGEGRNESFSK